MVQVLVVIEGPQEVIQYFQLSHHQAVVAEVQEDQMLQVVTENTVVQAAEEAMVLLVQVVKV